MLVGSEVQVVVRTSIVVHVVLAVTVTLSVVVHSIEIAGVVISLTTREEATKLVTVQFGRDTLTYFTTFVVQLLSREAGMRANVLAAVGEKASASITRTLLCEL